MINNNDFDVIKDFIKHDECNLLANTYDVDELYEFYTRVSKIYNLSEKTRPKWCNKLLCLINSRL